MDLPFLCQSFDDFGRACCHDRRRDFPGRPLQDLGQRHPARFGHFRPRNIGLDHGQADDARINQQSPVPKFFHLAANILRLHPLGI